MHQVSVTLTSPSGQTANKTWQSGFDSLRNELQVGVDMSSVSENGTWRLSSVSIGDSNDNYTYYDEAALDALGSTTFTVTGAMGDFTPPQVIAGGTNLTPMVSRSTPPRGMLPGNPARVGIEIDLADTGAAGLSSATMEFCHADMYWECFYVNGEVTVRGKSAVRLTLGGYVSNWNEIGNYKPYSLQVYDYAGNASYYYADWDNLDALLDNPVISVTE